jgi:hypothetical protein
LAGCPATDSQELKATAILWMAIEEGAAKVRNGPPIDDPKDISIPCWAGVVPVAPTLGKPIPDPLMKSGIAPPPDLRKIRIAAFSYAKLRIELISYKRKAIQDKGAEERS